MNSMRSAVGGFIVFIIFFISSSDIYSFHKFSKGSLTTKDPFSFDSLNLNDGTDPSKPVSRIDIQNDFYWDWLEFKDDRFYNALQLNGGKTFCKGSLYLYLKIPLITTNLTFETQTCFGDITFDLKYSTNKSGKLNFITGSEFIFPSGSSAETGLGKFIAGPYAGFIDYFNDGFYGLILTDYFSFAGQNNRNDIHELSINPLFKLNLGKNWYTLFTPDIIYTYRSGKFFIPYTQEFGKMFCSNYTLSLKAGIHLKNDNKYDVLVEMRISVLM